MNRNTLYIYTLIILECRLSSAEARSLFGSAYDQLLEFINNCNTELKRTVEFCFRTAYEYSLETKKRNIFKAKIFLRRLVNIRKKTNMAERKSSIETLVRELEGFEQFNNMFNKPVTEWSDEDKIKFLKFKIKYCLSDYNICNNYPIARTTIPHFIQKSDEETKRIIAHISDKKLNSFNMAYAFEHRLDYRDIVL